MSIGTDGPTRNDYRENVSLDKVLGNVKSYTDNGGKGIWQFIIFDYNRSEVNESKNSPEDLDLPSQQEKWRNSFRSCQVRVRNSKVHRHRKYEGRTEQGRIDVTTTAPNIRCRHKEKDEIFITSTGKVFPVVTYTMRVSGRIPNIT